MDGKSNCEDRWSGPIGKALTNVGQLPLDENFQVITDCQLPEMTPDVVNNFTSDQKYMFKIFCVVSSGKFPKERLQNQNVHHRKTFKVTFIKGSDIISRCWVKCCFHV